MLHRGEILRLIDHDRRTLARQGERLEILQEVTRFQTGEPAQHVVIYCRLSSENAAQAIDSEIKHFTKLGVRFEWKCYAHDAPADLLARLERRGFKIGAMEVVVVLDCTQRYPWMDNTGPGSVAKVGTIEQVEDFQKAAEAIFEKDYSFTANALKAAIASGLQQHIGYVAYHGKEPVGVGRLYRHADSSLAMLCGGGTREEYRGRGVYQSLVAARARDAVAAGTRYLQVDALPTSRPILERLGFEWVSNTWPCEWTRSQLERL